MKRGFSLVEILTTIVILGVLAAIAIPNFSKSRDKAAAAQAVAYLRTIRTGEKMYFAKNGNYWPSTVAGETCAGASCTAAEITAKLGAELSGATYVFTLTSAGGASPQTFTAQAVRGTCTFTLPTNGTFTASAGCPYTATQLNT